MKASENKANQDHSKKREILCVEVGQIKGLRSQLEKIIFAFDCKES